MMSLSDGRCLPRGVRGQPHRRCEIFQVGISINHRPILQSFVVCGLLSYITTLAARQEVSMSTMTQRTYIYFFIFAVYADNLSLI